MAIVDITYYESTYFGEAIADTDFDRFEARAQDLILMICKGKVTEDNFSDLPSELQTAVKKAICAEMEYFSLYGLEIATTGKVDNGFTVGKVRVDGSSSSSSNASAKATISPLAISYLEQTGLLDPEIGVSDYIYVDFRRFV